MPRRQRSLSPATLVDALAAIDATRRTCTEAEIGGPEYEATGKAIDALDGLTGALTGNPELFWPKPHGSGSRG